MLKTTPIAGAEASFKAVDDFAFLTLEAKLAFLRLRQAFTEVHILHHFDPECYIWIKIDSSDYAIDSILSELILEFDH